MGAWGDRTLKRLPAPIRDVRSRISRYVWHFPLAQTRGEGAAEAQQSRLLRHGSRYRLQRHLPFVLPFRFRQRPEQH